MGADPNSSPRDGASGDRSAEGNRRGHVLIIDDEVSILDVLTEILSDDGWRVTGMLTPPSLTDIQAHSPNLILLDLLFQGLHEGLPLLKALRADPSTTTIPIVICTAIPHPEELMTAMGLPPMMKILGKPFDLDDVVATIGAVTHPSIQAPDQD